MSTGDAVTLVVPSGQLTPAGVVPRLRQMTVVGLFDSGHYEYDATLALVHLEDFGPSYARTLHDWRERFLARREDVRAQGFDERFLRMWEFYLAYCEGGFLERSIGVAHLLLAKPGYRGASYLPGLLEA